MVTFRWFVRGRKMRRKLSRDGGRDPQKVFLESHYPREVPRILWNYWQQGEDAAPELVKSCIASWRSLNPGWEIRVLDQESVPRFIDMTGVPESIGVQHYTDVLRVRLLDQHGGAWADATTFCATPLDHWLPPLMQSGFFAFSQPASDRVIASWFLASQPGGAVIRAWRRATDEYWSSVSRADHYYWLHYLFEWLTRRNPEVNALWAQVPHISADGPLLIQRCLRHGYDVTRIDEGADLEAIPIHKLNWRENTSIRDVQRILRHERLTPSPRSG